MKTSNTMAGLVLGGAFLLTLPTFCSANLLVNGSFEDPVVEDSNANGWITVFNGSTIGSSGWVVAQNSVDVHAREFGTKWTCNAGLQALDLSGGDQGIIYQEVAVTKGAQYLLTFYMSANLAGAPTITSLDVYADGAKLGQADFDRTGASCANMNWQLHSYLITATSSSMKVEFRSLTPGSCGPAIDNVQLAPVPEPSTWVAGGLTLLAMVSPMIRRRR